MATADFTELQGGTPEPVVDRVFEGGAMLGAACGALVGVGLAGDVFAGGYTAAVFGTFGTVLGSLGCALAGRYLVYPAWIALRRTRSRV
jgi:uncharacterized membrane protein